MDAGDFLTVREAATVMKLGPETIRRFCASGRLRATLISRKGGWRIPASEIRRVLSGGATPTAAGK